MDYDARQHWNRFLTAILWIVLWAALCCGLGFISFNYPDAMFCIGSVLAVCWVVFFAWRITR